MYDNEFETKENKMLTKDWTTTLQFTSFVFWSTAIVQYTATGENKASFEPFLLYYVNHVLLMQTSIFQKRKEVFIWQGQLQPHIHLYKW